MGLQDLISADVNGVMLNTSDFAVSAIYTDADGNRHEVTVVITSRGTAEHEDTYNKRQETELETFCAYSAVGIIDPSVNAKLEIGNEVFRFKHIVEQDDSGITIKWTKSGDVRTRSNS